jgi:CRISPR-associated protein Cas1
MRESPKPKVVAAHGYGISVTVRRGHLIVEDGVGKHRRSRRFNRATPHFDRLVVHGHSGIISLDAIRWLSDVGASFVQIDHDAKVLATSTPGHEAKPQFLVSQIEAKTNGLGVKVMRKLITEKIDGQLKNLRYLKAKPRVVALVMNHRERARKADTFDAIRDAEKLSGKQYWGAWAGLPVQFENRDAGKIPEHWVRFNRRRSTLSEGNRKAIDPPNALLNYLFGILEAETKLTAMEIGLNPYIGVMHADLPFRASLAADLMEPGGTPVNRHR